MGSPMVLNLIKVGHALVVHDIRRNMADAPVRASVATIFSLILDGSL